MSRRSAIKSGQLDITNWDYLATVTGRDDLSTMADTVIHPRHKEIGLHYQQFVYGLLVSLPPGDITVVETGVRTGISTYFILAALEARGKDQGHLYSCDPLYRSQGLAQNRFKEYEYFPYWRGKDAFFENWTFHGERSNSALPKVATKAPIWDVFVHDSDHSAGNMKFELKFAWERLRPGGFLVVDDPGGTAAEGFHTVFTEWAEEHELWWSTLGQAVIVQKPGQLITGERTLTEMKADEYPSANDPTLPVIPGIHVLGSIEASTVFLESAESEAQRLTQLLAEAPPYEMSNEAMEAAVKAAVAKAPSAPPAEEEKEDDNAESGDLSDLADLNKPSKGGQRFSDDDLDELGEE